MVFSEENFELEKQMGCMAGIFQIFDRHHLLTGRRHGQKRIPLGKSSSNKRGGTLVQNKSSHQATLEKTLSKTLTENSSLSMESSRASCSSSSCSSFSSVNETFFTEKPSKETLKPKNALDLRDIVKESINREPLRGLNVKTDKIIKEHKDSPRPLLLSKSLNGTYVIGIDRSINNNVHEYNNNKNISNNNNKYYSRYSCDGRDSGPQNCTKSSDPRLIKDLPRLSLDSKKESLTKSNFDHFDSPGQHRRSNSLIARLMGLDLEPDNEEKLNPVGEIQTRRDVCLVNKFGGNEIENLKFENEIGNSNLVVKIKRVETNNKKTESEIEKKLREFESFAKINVENTKKCDNNNNKFTKKGEKSLKGFESPIVIMKPAKYKNKSQEFEEKNKCFKEREQGLKTKTKQSNSGANSPRTPPRISQKKGDLDRKSRPNSPNRNSGNLLSDKISRPTSPKMKKNLSKKLDEVEISTPKASNCKVIKENVSENVVSPVSVLGATFYHDELTPEKILFKDGEICTSEESWNPKSLPDSPPSDQIKSKNIETLIQKLEQLSSANEEPPSGTLITPETLRNKNHEYIHEILSASGLLNKDLSFILQSEYPINPDLFLVLEQTKTGDKSERNHRKFVFNMVNEILGCKLDSGFSNQKRVSCMKGVGGKQLFEDLCNEIDKFQTENYSKRLDLEFGDEEKEEFEISDEEMIGQMKGWEKFEAEMQEMVFEIEKSIFKNLIEEVLEMEVKDVRDNNQRRIRRQLF